MKGISIRKLPEGLMPQNIGEMSFARDVPISGVETRNEWRVRLPCGHTIALVEPTHQVFETNEKSSGGGNYGITVHPSVVCPSGDWHGFIAYSRMTEA